MLPTPTPLPVNAPMIAVNLDNFRMWEFTDDAIQIWNYEPALGQMIQTAVIIIIIVSFVTLMIYLVQNTMVEGE